MVYAKITFLLKGFCIPSFRAIAYAIDKQSGTCRRYLLLQGLYVPSVKTTTYVLKGLILSVLKTTKHTWLYPATHYSTRLQVVKERIDEGSIGMF